jgi:hypothetical protein
LHRAGQKGVAIDNTKLAPAGRLSALFTLPNLQG